LYRGPMCGLGSAPIILAMARTTTSSKVLLVADRRTPAGTAGSTPVRRYRLARLRFEGRVAEPASRFEHLKRVFD
jgi:hypothetical protein